MVRGLRRQLNAGSQLCDLRCLKLQLLLLLLLSRLVDSWKVVGFVLVGVCIVVDYNVVVVVVDVAVVAAAIIAIDLVLTLVGQIVVHPMESDLVLDLFALLLGHSSKLYRITRHPKSYTFFQPTILASISVDSIDGTILVPLTLVVDYGRLASSKETLATLAGDDTIVDARRFVAAHLAGYDFDLS